MNPYNNHAPRPTPFDLKAYTKKDAEKDEETIANPPSRTLLEEAIKRRLLLDWQDGILMNRRMVMGRLEQWGLKINRKRAARTVLTGMCYSVGSATRQGSSSLTRFIGQSAITSSTWRR